MLCMNWPLLHSHIVLDSLFCLSSLLVMLRFPLVMLSLKGGKLLVWWLVWCKGVEGLTWAVTTRVSPTLCEGSRCIMHRHQFLGSPFGIWCKDAAHRRIYVSGPGIVRFYHKLLLFSPSGLLYLYQFICFINAHSLATIPTQLGQCWLNTEAVISRYLAFHECAGQPQSVFAIGYCSAVDKLAPWPSAVVLDIDWLTTLCEWSLYQ